VGVVELGMNHPGEIALLARIAQPTVALVNNAQREHLEFMHTVQAVAEENGSVLAALPADGVAVFPAGDAYTALWQGLAAGRRCITFGGALADVQLHTGPVAERRLAGHPGHAARAAGMCAAHCGPPQRDQRPGCRSLRIGGGRATGRHRARPERVRAGQGPFACAGCA
jgi:UDP-N-acetylmuramyl pentapeptide synthase